MPVRSALTRPLLCCFILGTFAVPPCLGAQMPGAPILQNAFANRGVTVAGNYASADGASLLALALAYSPGAGRFQFSGGTGRLSSDEGDDITVWGARVAVPVLSFAAGRGGVAPFGGIGGGSTEAGSVLHVPLGVGAGWRMALGTTRALSFYATGTYLWVRTKVGDESERNGLVRVAGAADVTVIRNLALTVGFEGGQNADPDQLEGGPSGTIFGAPWTAGGRPANDP
jgi:hypothetical protein